MVTTQDEIYRRVRDALATSLSSTDGLSDSKVQVVSEENPDLSSNLFVQVRPSGGAMGTPRVGSQLVDDRIEVTTWLRRAKDAGGKATLALAGEDNSMYARIEAVRAPLRNSWLDGALEVPLRQVAHGNPVRSADNPLYWKVRDVWACSYELSSDVSFMGFSASAPTTLTGLVGAPREAALGVSRDATDPSFVWALIPQTVGDVVFWTEGGAVEFYSDLDQPPAATFDSTLGGTASSTGTDTQLGGTASSTGTDTLLGGSAGSFEPGCTTVTIGGIVYRQWRSPYRTAALSAIYRVRGV